MALNNQDLLNAKLHPDVLRNQKKNGAIGTVLQPLQSLLRALGGTSVDGDTDADVIGRMATLAEDGEIDTAVFGGIHALTFDDIYPVGSIYMSVNSTDPGTLFGGTWQQIEDTFLLSAGQTYTAGDTGGKASYDAADMPKHSHTRGTMNITGSTKWLAYDTVFGGAGTADGAFRGYSTDGSTLTNVAKSGTGSAARFNFDASYGWTGSTSEVGTNTNATILPPYLVVYMWKRTA